MRLARRPEPFDHTDFIYEINKFDGFRALACIDCCEHKSRDGEVLNHSLWRRQGNSARRVWGSDSELDLQHSRAAVVYERVELTAVERPNSRCRQARLNQMIAALGKEGTSFAPCAPPVSPALK